MPAPPSNPLSMLRRLGTSLIGRDGLLTDAASTALGYSPMDRVKNRLAAQQEVRGEVDFQNRIAQEARKVKADELALESGQYDLGRRRTTDTREDATRAGTGSAIAARLGQPDMNPDTAIGTVAGETAVNNMERTSGREKMTPALFNELKNLNMDPGVQIGEEFDTSQMDRAISARNVNEATKARLQAAREAVANRNFQRSMMTDQRRLSTFLDEQNRVAQSPQIRASQQIIATALDTQAQVDHYKNAVATGDTDTANQILGEVITVAFAKVRDANSVVREGEVVRLLQQWGLADRAGNWLGKQIDGGVLPPDALLKLEQALQVDAAVSHRIIKGEQDRLEQMRLGDPQSGALPEYYKRDFTFGYTPRTGAPQPPPAPGAAPRTAPPASTAEDFLIGLGIPLPAPRPRR